LPIVCHPASLYANPDKTYSFCLSVRLAEITPETLAAMTRAIDSVYKGAFRYEPVPYRDRV